LRTNAQSRLCLLARGFLGIVAYYVAANGTLQDLPIALPQLTGAYSSKRIAKVVVIML
jgi:hypothetical protein